MLLGTALAQQTPASNSPAPATKAQPPAAAQTSSASFRQSEPVHPCYPEGKLSYALGMNIGKNLHRDAIEIDPNLLLQGMKDAIAGGQTLMTDQEAQAAVTELQNDLRQEAGRKDAGGGRNNQKEGEAFLAATKPSGDCHSASGLQYKILRQVRERSPRATDSVVCNYRGTLIDGTEFDSSYKRGQPATFPVNGVIKGWTEALQLMPVGSKWQLFVPADLAYGARVRATILALTRP